MISVVDVETSWQVTDTGGYDPSPYHPDNILVSVGINDEYYFTNHSERVDQGCYHKIQSILDNTTLLIGHNIKFDLMWLLESGFKYTGKVYDTMLGEYILNRGIRKSLTLEMSCRRRKIGSKDDRIKEFMDRGDLVPDEVVVNMVKSRLNEPDCAGGWLLDGYPRSASQAEALSSYGIEPDLFLLLDVPDEELLERVVGRRLDPVTGQIYHLKFFPPPDETVAKRLTQRSDDTEEKAQNRLKVHHANVNAVLSKYKNIMKTIDGNRQKTTVFKEIEGLINSM